MRITLVATFLMLIAFSTGRAQRTDVSREFTTTLWSTNGNDSTHTERYVVPTPDLVHSHFGIPWNQISISSASGLDASIQRGLGKVGAERLDPRQFFRGGFYSQGTDSVGFAVPGGLTVTNRTGALSILLTSTHDVESYADYSPLPVSSWGHVYVVSGLPCVDSGRWPSPSYPMFSISAAEDGTVVTIVSPQSLYQAVDRFDRVANHPANIPFTVTLGNSYAVTYFADSGNTAGGDLSGTIVTANKPVSVLSQIADANVQPTDREITMVGDVLLPKELWGRSYVSAPFYAKNRDRFLITGTVDGQTVSRRDSAGLETRMTINKDQVILSPAVTSTQRWTSDHPFNLVQIALSFYDSGGPMSDGAMLSLQPTELYTNDLLFQTHLAARSESRTDTVRLVVVSEAGATVYYNGKLLSGEELFSDGSLRVTRIAADSGEIHSLTSNGKLTVTSHEHRIGVTATSGGLGKVLPTSRGTLPGAPRWSQTSSDCECITTRFVVQNPNKEKIASVEMLNRVGLSADIVAGGVADTAVWLKICPTNTVQGSVSIKVSDDAGKATIATSSYERQPWRIAAYGDTTVVIGLRQEYFGKFRIFNSESAPFRILTSYLRSGRGITSVPSVIDQDSDAELTIALSAVSDTLSYRDTIIVRGECDSISVPLSIRYISPHVILADHNFGAVPVGESRVNRVYVSNLSDAAGAVLSVFESDDPSFAFYDSIGRLPLTITRNSSGYLYFAFTPPAVGDFESRVALITGRFDTVSATFRGKGVVSSVPQLVLPDFSIHPTFLTSPGLLELRLPSDVVSARVTLTDIKGQVITQKPISPVEGRCQFDTGDLGSGKYFIEITSDDRSFITQIVMAR